MNKIINSALMLISLTSVNTHVQAEDWESGFFISPMIGAYDFDEDRMPGISNEIDLFLGFGYQFNSPWAVELAFLKAETESKAINQDVDLEQKHLDVLYHFNRTADLSIYALLGIGESEYETALGNTDENLIEAGVGAKYKLSPAWSFRTDFRVINGREDSDNDIALHMGLSYLFGADSKGKPKPVRSETTAKPVSPAKPQALDSDSDGVVDAQDRCPNTVAGIVVDSHGCPLDDDNDGVANVNDKCPDTSAGAKVDETGCYIILKERREFTLNVTFANGSNEVPTEYLSEVKSLAQFMREFPLTKVVIEGHTDNRGAAAFNQNLSEQRAAAVAQLLVSKYNIDSSRVSSVGFGETKPIADNDLAEGRAKNRRVVAVLSATVEKIVK